MKIQDKIEQISKEYINRKFIYDEKKKKIEENKNDFAKSTLGLTEEEVVIKVFEEKGAVELMTYDINEVRAQLYYYIKLAEDTLEIPQEIKDLVLDYKPNLVYTASGKIANKGLYEQHKLQYLQTHKVQNFLYNNQEFQKIINSNV